MYFRNITLFRFPAAAGDTFLRSLWDALASCRAKPVGPGELRSRGFVSPYGASDDALHVRVGMDYWICLGGEDRVLPAAAVNREFGRRLAEIEGREGRRLHTRARKRLKEDVVIELLPRALIKPYRLNAYLDLKRGWLLVDSAGRRPAENLVSELRHALGSFPALPANAEVSPRAVLTGWMYGEPMPQGLALGDGCLMRDPVDGGASVRLTRQELAAEEVHRHLEAGKQCARLAVTFQDRLSCEIGEDLVLRKVRLLDGALTGLEDVEHEDLHAELDARFALMAGTLGELLDVLEPALSLSKAEG